MFPSNSSNSFIDIFCAVNIFRLTTLSLYPRLSNQFSSFLHFRSKRALLEQIPLRSWAWQSLAARNKFLQKCLSKNVRCCFSENVFSKESAKSFFSVTFNVIKSHIITEYFIKSFSEDMKIFSFNSNYFQCVFWFFGISLL